VAVDEVAKNMLATESSLRGLTFDMRGGRRIGPRGGTITWGASRAKPVAVRSMEGLDRTLFLLMRTWFTRHDPLDG
jgi:hypothetical protein